MKKASAILLILAGAMELAAGILALLHREPREY